MALPTGTISMSQVNVELGKSSTALIRLGDSDVRTLAGVPSGAISMDDLRGQSAYTPISVVVSPGSAGGTYPNWTGPKTYGFSATVSDGDGSHSYTWSVSGSGISISSGQGTSSVIVSVSNGSNSFYSGSVTCTVNDGTSSDNDSSSIYVNYGTIE